MAQKFDVWKDASGENTIWSNLFIPMASLVGALGVVTSIVVGLFVQSLGFDMALLVEGPNVVVGIAIYVGAIVLYFVGMSLALGLACSPNPAVAFPAFLVGASMYGILLGPVFSTVIFVNVLNVLLLTGCIVAGFGVLGLLIPKNLSFLNNFFLNALLGLIIGYLIFIVAGMFGAPVSLALGWWDMLGLVIFVGLVVYDFNRMKNIPHNMPNAILSGISLYLDFMYIFVVLLPNRRK